MSLYSSKTLLKEVCLSILILSLIIFTHEMGHVAFGLAVGQDSEVVFISGPDRGLQAYGFATVFSRPLTPEETVFIAWGGIAFNLLTAGMSFILFRKVDSPLWKDFLFILLVASVMSAFLNALPIEPFDGSRIFKL